MKGTLKISVVNTFVDEVLCEIFLPWNPFKATLGRYSQLVRESRIDWASAKKIDKHFIKTKINLLPTTSKRIVIEFPSGTKLDMPDNPTEKDFKIIDLHLQAAKLACEK